MTVTSLEERLTSVRAEFPALSRRGPLGDEVIYADAPGGTQVPQRVIDAMSDYLVGHNSNTEGEFAATRETDAVIWRARESAAAFVGGRPEEISFGQNMTSLNFNLARAVGRTMSPGDEIVVTQLDHDANVSPWLLLAQDRDFVVRTVGLTPELDIDLEQLADVVGPRTRVVAATLASNAVGTTPDARAVSEIAHAHGALAWFDAVAYAPHRRIDVAALGADVLLCSPYKFFGPHQGLSWLRRDLAESLPAERVRPAGQYPPGHRFETGTLSHEGIAGCQAAIDYLASLGSGDTLVAQLDSAYQQVNAHERGLIARFLDGAHQLPGASVLGRPTTDGRVCTFGLKLHDHDPAEAARQLDALGIFAWNGNFYAQGVMEALGIPVDEGILRLGFVHYATSEEIDRCLEALRGILGGRR